jgi:hypothetical protein
MDTFPMAPLPDGALGPTPLLPTEIYVPGVPLATPPASAGTFVGLEDIEVSCPAPATDPVRILATVDLRVRGNTKLLAIVTLVDRSGDGTGRLVGRWTVPVHESAFRILRIIGPTHWEDELEAGSTGATGYSHGPVVRAWSCSRESGGPGAAPLLACRFTLGTVLVEKVTPDQRGGIHLLKRMLSW